MNIHFLRINNLLDPYLRTDDGKSDELNLI